MSERALPDAERLLLHLAEQIRPRIGTETGLIGIHTGGVWVAERLHALLGCKVALGTIDINFYRDDFDQRGLSRDLKPSTIPFDVTDRHLILVDDVLYTGRTIRAAMNELFDYGRPGKIELAALVDRGGRQLPIAPQFVGAQFEVGEHESVELSRDDTGALSLTLRRRDG